ncbi:hypothetical protein MRX96_057436 [Rhipicephalus microplus]
MMMEEVRAPRLGRSESRCAVTAAQIEIYALEASGATLENDDSASSSSSSRTARDAVRSCSAHVVCSIGLAAHCRELRLVWWPALGRLTRKRCHPLSGTAAAPAATVLYGRRAPRRSSIRAFEVPPPAVPPCRSPLPMNCPRVWVQFFV